jgi:hypothetical protein
MARGFNPVVVHSGDKVVHHKFALVQRHFLTVLPSLFVFSSLARAGADNVLENEGTETNDACTFHSMVVCIYT